MLFYSFSNLYQNKITLHTYYVSMIGALCMKIDFVDIFTWQKDNYYVTLYWLVTILNVLCISNCLDEKVYYKCYY